MNTNKLILAASLAGLCLPALSAELEDAGQASQPAPAAKAAPALAGAQRMQIDVMRESPRRTVKNAPYSAEMVTERIRMLADGNQITQKSVTMSYRDSAGRARYETRDARGELASVSIHDPVEGVTWALNPRDKTATRFRTAGMDPGAIAARIAAEAARSAAQAHRASAEANRAAAEAARAGAEAGRAAAEAARVRVDELRKDGVLPEGQAGGHAVTVRRFEVPGHEGKAAGASPVHIQVTPALVEAFSDRSWSANASSKDLGTRDFDGVKAQGKLRSYEIPAGAIGNSKPIVVSDETWYAQDLQVTVSTRHSDPRSGEVLFHLDKIKREEPAAALFSVPSDYTIKDLSQPGKPGAQPKAP